MRRSQLIIIAITIAAAVAALAPAVAERAREREAPATAPAAAPSDWPGVGARLAGKPPGYAIALYGNLAIADALRGAAAKGRADGSALERLALGASRLATTADAEVGPRGGALALATALGGPQAAAAPDAPGSRFVLEVPVGAARQQVAFFASAPAAADAAALAAEIGAYEAAEPGACTVVYLSAAVQKGARASARADAARRLRRAGAEIVIWYGDGLGALSQYERRWVFYGLGAAADPERMVLRLLVGADAQGAPRIDLRGYPVLGERAATAKEYGAAYWRLIVGSWAPEEHQLKRRVGFGFDDVGRFLSFGRIAAGEGG